MFRASVIGLIAAAALAVGASSASAGVNFDVNVGLGSPGFYGGPVYGDPVYSPYYYEQEDDCHFVKVKKLIKNNGQWKKVWIKKLVCY